MTLNDILSILPLIVPAIAVILLMLLITVFRNHLFTVSATLVLLFVSLIMVFFSYEQQPRQISQLLIMDGYAYFYIALIYAATMVVCALSYGYFKHKKVIKEEYYLFLLTTALGCGVLVASSHFASLFVGIELLSLSLYVLITYTGTKPNVEAGIKYFVMTAVSITFLLFGIALIYAACGSMKFSAVQADIFNSTLTNHLLYLAGIVLFLVGIGFKLALVPFHYWIADVFEGAPAPVAGFLGTVSKGAVFAVLMRYFFRIDILSHNSLYFIFAAVAAASMFFGNITALLQTKIKRILGYSSIAHFGYLLVTLIAGNSIAITAASFYLTAYFVTILAAFGVITFLSKGGTDFDAIEDYRGLAFTHPVYTVLLTIAMLSLAGIPLTAGFIAKFYIIAVGANIKLWSLLVILVINSVIGLFYYLRIVVSLYTKSMPDNILDNEEDVFGPSFSLPGVLSLSILLFLLIYIGINPGPLVNFIEKLMNISGV
jgi:NADH-quinone oxidoreductase subunit N